MSEWRSLERPPRDDGFRPDPPPGFPRAARPMEAASSAGERAASSMYRRGRSQAIGRKKRASGGFANSVHLNSEICKMSEWRSLERSPRDDGFRPDPPPGFPRAARPMEAASSAGERAASSMYRRGRSQAIGRKKRASGGFANSVHLNSEICKMSEWRSLERPPRDDGYRPDPPPGFPRAARPMEAASSAGERAASSMYRRGRSQAIGRKKRASGGFAITTRPNSEIRKMSEWATVKSAPKVFVNGRPPPTGLPLIVRLMEAASGAGEWAAPSTCRQRRFPGAGRKKQASSGSAVPARPNSEIRKMSEWATVKSAPKVFVNARPPPAKLPLIVRLMEAASGAGEWAAPSTCRQRRIPAIGRKKRALGGFAVSARPNSDARKMSEWRSLERSPRDDGYRPDPPTGLPLNARLMEAASSAGERAASSTCRRGRSPTIGRVKGASSGLAISARSNSEIRKMSDQHPLGSFPRDARRWLEEARAGWLRGARPTNSKELHNV